MNRLGVCYLILNCTVCLYVCAHSVVYRPIFKTRVPMHSVWIGATKWQFDNHINFKNPVRRRDSSLLDWTKDSYCCLRPTKTHGNWGQKYFDHNLSLNLWGFFKFSEYIAILMGPSLFNSKCMCSGIPQKHGMCTPGCTSKEIPKIW